MPDPGSTPPTRTWRGCWWTANRSASACAQRGDPADTTGSTAAGLIDINTASMDQLQQIPGVGPVLAQRIVTYRGAERGFQAVEQLTEVSGIGGGDIRADAADGDGRRWWLTGFWPACGRGSCWVSRVLVGGAARCRTRADVPAMVGKCRSDRPGRRDTPGRDACGVDPPPRPAEGTTVS